MKWIAYISVRSTISRAYNDGDMKQEWKLKARKRYRSIWKCENFLFISDCFPTFFCYLIFFVIPKTLAFDQSNWHEKWQLQSKVFINHSDFGISSTFISINPKNLFSQNVDILELVTNMYTSFNRTYWCNCLSIWQ